MPTYEDLDVSGLIDLTDQIDYTSLDWVAFLIDTLNLIPAVLPEWTDISPTDFGVVLLELFSSIADRVSYRTDVIANEAHMQTAVERRSVENLAKLINYTPNPRTSATVDITFGIDPEPFDRVIPVGTKVSTRATAEEEAVIYEVYEEIDVLANETSVTGSVVQGTSLTDFTPIGSSTALPSQFFILADSPISYFPSGENSLEVYVTAGAITTRWTEVETLLDSIPSDEHYEVEVAADETVTVLFGDGNNGKIPSAGTDNITIKARIGGGTIGNAGVGTINTLVSTLSMVISVTNAARATGGLQRESILSIKSMAPRMLRTLWRAVTAEDYKTLTESIAGVAKAMPVVSSGGFFNHVNLHIVPTGGGLPSTALKDAVQEFIDERQLLTVVTTVEDPVYVDATVDVEVTLKSNALQSEMEIQINEVVAAFFHWSVMDFGQAARKWDFIAAIDNLVGVDYGELNIFSKTGSGVGDITVDDDEFLKLEDVNYTLTLHGGIS